MIRLEDLWQVIKHIPPRQLARRFYLTEKRRVLDNLLRVSPLKISSQNYDTNSLLPLPRLYPSHGRLKRTVTGWSATFLSKTVEFQNSIDWNNSNYDASTQLWQMNLHYFEYLPDIKFHEAELLIRDWIVTCRPNCTTSTHAAWNGYALSLRLSAWIDFATLNDCDMKHEFRQLFLSSIVEQANYLSSHFETDILGNHVIKNIRALYECAAYFNHAAITLRWLSKAQHWLSAQLPIQILPDGMHFERSPSYHVQVFADLITVFSIMPQDKNRIVLSSYLKKMAQVTSDILHPDQQVSQFNDSGLSMTTNPVKCLEMLAHLLEISVPTPQYTFCLPHAGFYGLRDNKNYIIFKMGYLGPDELMAHAHCDWGSFEWSYLGKRIIVDQGVFEYVHGEKRAKSRSTLMHNTVTADSREQACFVGAFRCATRPAPKSAHFLETESGFELTGFLDYADGGERLNIKRRAVFNARNLLIEDSADSCSELRSAFLLHPDVVPELVSDTKLLININGGARLILSVTHSSKLAIEQATWWPDMGKQVGTHRIIVSTYTKNQEITISH